MSKSHASLLPKSEDQIKAVFDTLSEKDRRRYVASLSLLLPHGGCTYLSELLKCSLSTIYRGRRELQQLEQEGDPADGRIRREGAGRPKKEDDHPELVKALEEILDERTAGSPTQQTVRWTWLTVSAITKRLCEVCTFVSRPVVARLCRALNLKKRLQVKSVTKAPSRNRNEQFGIIDRLREEFRRTKDAIFSVDSKQKELLGKVFRPGMVLADGPVEVLDHALPSYAQGEVITHGIYDPQLNRAHMNLNTSHDTGEFACASLRWFWQNLGRHRHALADRILLLLDCGGSNSFRSNVFKSHLSRLSTQMRLADSGGSPAGVLFEVQPNRATSLPLGRTGLQRSPVYGRQADGKRHRKHGPHIDRPADKRSRDEEHVYSRHKTPTKTSRERAGRIPRTAHRLQLSSRA